LYYRLNVVRLRTPALREIREDIPMLAAHFLGQACEEHRLGARKFSQEALKALAAAEWRGNVRQLENEVRKTCIMAAGTVIGVEDLSAELLRPEERAMAAAAPGVATADRGTGAVGLQAEIEELERRRIGQALEATRYNQLRAAKKLGLSRQGLINKMKRYGIQTAMNEEEQ
jgi:DNA-binding NtrC family response regulator